MAQGSNTQLDAAALTNPGQHQQQLPTHLIVMVNGLWGFQKDWSKMQQALQAASTDGSCLILVSGVNTGAATYDDPKTRKVAGLNPSHFVSIATPHIGCCSDHPDEYNGPMNFVGRAVVEHAPPTLAISSALSSEAAGCDGKFGPFIEGTAVNKQGQAFAVNAGNQRNTIGRLTGDCGVFATVTDVPNTELNSIRVLPDGRMLAGDTNNQRIVLGGSSQQLALLGRTNGIELSPDEKSLYVSESFNSGGRPISNKIWRYSLKPDGTLGSKTLFFDFQQDGTATIDIDGMRSDTKGNLYVTRHEGQAVVKFSPSGKTLKKFSLKFSAATNLELGGPQGKTLYVVGRCGVGVPWGAGAGCVQQFKVEAPGRALTLLQQGKPVLGQSG
ncbi:hypothetical protein COO60DRAFT_1458642 [Scenedesmus sp. NREL 46B-D3]|nr:hypothetical protein COO60DRAFT_1458642 [Scenedesmus sp. NREL 46B-D3]